MQSDNCANAVQYSLTNGNYAQKLKAVSWSIMHASELSPAYQLTTTLV